MECLGRSYSFGNGKRMRSFPFTYDQHPGPDRHLVAERGASAQYWAKRTIRNGPAVTHQYALASRNGLGRVVLMQTTDDRYGPGKFTLVTKLRGRKFTYLTSSNETFAAFEAENVVSLTGEQRTPVWFNQRQFRITGTSALAIWKRYAYLARAGEDEGRDMSNSLRSTCKILGLKYSNEPIPNETDADRIYVKDELLALSVMQLKEICRQKSLPVSGTKAGLVERVLSWGGSSNGNRPAVLELLLEKWFIRRSVLFTPK